RTDGSEARSLGLALEESGKATRVARGHTDARGLPTSADPAPPGVLGDVRDVRDGRGGWTDGHRAAGADRQGLRDRQGSGEPARYHFAGADIRAVARPNTERPDAPLLRLGVGQHRPREHDADRVRARSGDHHVAVLLWPG